MIQVLMLIICHLKSPPTITSDIPIPWNNVSVLIPVAGKLDYILDTVNSVVSSAGDGVTICVIDNGPLHRNSKFLRFHFTFTRLSQESVNLISSRTKSTDLEQVYLCNLPNNSKIYILEKSDTNKSNALNLGIKFVSADYIICLDADSILEKHALNNILIPLVGSASTSFAVGGCVLPIYEDTLLCRFQEYEYIKAFFIFRRFCSIIHENLLISGAFGAFRRDILTNPEINCYNTSCVGEDFELTVKINIFSRSHNYRNTIFYVQDAYCFTHVPDTVKKLFRQRTRWQSGLIEVFRLHQQLKEPIFHCFTWWYIYFYEFLSPIIEIFCFFYLIANTQIEHISHSTIFFFLTISAMINFLIRNFFSDKRSFLSHFIDSIVFHPILLAARLYAIIVNYLHCKIPWK